MIKTNQVFSSGFFFKHLQIQLVSIHSTMWNCTNSSTVSFKIVFIWLQLKPVVELHRLGSSWRRFPRGIRSWNTRLVDINFTFNSSSVNKKFQPRALSTHYLWLYSHVDSTGSWFKSHPRLTSQSWLITIEKLVLGETWTEDLPIFSPDLLTFTPSRHNKIRSYFGHRLLANFR